MATPCFCGHGQPVKGIRLRATNAVGSQMQTDLSVFEGALGDGLDGDGRAGGGHVELRELVTVGRPLLGELSAVVHGGPKASDFKERVTAWMDRAKEHRGTIEAAVREAGFVGTWFGSTGEQVYGGTRVDGVVVAVRDTGTTVNNDPRVELTLRVEGPDGNPLELSRKLLVPRVNIPRPNDRVEVAYDPDDPSQFVFRPVPVPDEPVEDDDSGRIEQLERLARLREAGALSDEEFETEKRRVLADD